MYSVCTRMVNSCPWPHTHHFPCTVRPHWPLPKWLQQVWMAVAGSNGYSRPKWLQQAQNGFGAWSKVLVPQPSLSCQLHCSLGEWNKVLQAGDFLPRAHTACVVQHAWDTPMFDATEIVMSCPPRDAGLCCCPSVGRGASVRVHLPPCRVPGLPRAQLWVSSSFALWEQALWLIFLLGQHFGDINCCFQDELLLL